MFQKSVLDKYIKSINAELLEQKYKEFQNTYQNPQKIEQIKASKEARTADRKPTVYKFDTSKRKRAENVGKRGLIETIQNALADYGCDNIEVTNVEREIIFMSDGTKYKIVLSAPRK